MKAYLRLLFESTWLTVIWWLVVALAATLSGYSGILCMTPLPVAMAVFSGLQAYRFSISREVPHPIRMAALAGGLTGFINGFISTGVAYLTILLPSVDDVPTPGIFAVFAAIGALSGAILGWLAALIQSNRR